MRRRLRSCCEALADSRERSVVAYTSTGLVREVQLRARLSFRLRSACGKELIAPTEILQTRELSYNEGIALAKQYEEAFQFKAMQTDIVAQVIRRLAAVPRSEMNALRRPSRSAGPLSAPLPSRHGVLTVTS